MDGCARPREIGSLPAMDAGRDDPGPGRRRSRSPPIWRARVFELAEALFQSIRMQLSVPRYKAIAVGRGANLDTIDVPLNNRRLAEAAVRASARADRRRRRGCKAIDAIVELDRPRARRLLRRPGQSDCASRTWSRGPGFAKDPAFLRVRRWSASATATGWPHVLVRPRRGASTTRPLRMHYDGLDPAAHYKVRVVYAGDQLPARAIRLAADENEVHPFSHKPSAVKPLEFDIPARGHGERATALRPGTWQPRRRRQRPRLPGGRSLADEEVSGPVAPPEFGFTGLRGASLLTCPSTLHKPRPRPPAFLATPLLTQAPRPWWSSTFRSCATATIALGVTSSASSSRWSARGCRPRP